MNARVDSGQIRRPAAGSATRDELMCILEFIATSNNACTHFNIDVANVEQASVSDY